MIKPEELRIGNLLTSKAWGGSHRVDGIEKKRNSFELKIGGYIHKCTDPQYFDLQPIPITEQWLIDFEFEKIYPDHDHLPSWRKGELYFGDFLDEGHGLELCNFESAQCKYVHQLQNLYYAFKKIEMPVGFVKDFLQIKKWGSDNLYPESLKNYHTKPKTIDIPAPPKPPKDRIIKEGRNPPKPKSYE